MTFTRQEEIRNQPSRVIDESLILRLKNDDAEAFRTLYEQASTAVFGYAFSVLKNYDDACDVTQDTFLKVRSACALYEPQGKPMAWILTIAKNLCSMKFRQKKTSVQADDTVLDYLQPLAAIRDIELRVTLESALRVLNDTERQVIILHAQCGLKHREIAALLDMPLPTVLAKYHRGLKKMRQSLEGIRDE